MSDPTMMNGIVQGDKLLDLPRWAETIDLIVKREVDKSDVWVDIKKDEVPIALGNLGSRLKSKKSPIRFYANSLESSRNKLRIYDSAGIVYDEILKIPGLESYDGAKIHKSDDNCIRIRCPYGPIFHEKQRPDSTLFTTDLNSLSDNDRMNVEAFRHICDDPLINKYLSRPWSDELTKSTDIRFEDIWKVYAPSSYVKVRTLKDQSSIRKVDGANLKPATYDSDKMYTISCTSISWGGKSFKETRSYLKIKFYAGTRKLDSFRAQPIPAGTFDGDEVLPWVRNGLRYCRYWKSPAVAVKEYEGVALEIPEGYAEDTDSEDEARKVEVVRGRTVIDPKAIERQSALIKSWKLSSEEEFSWGSLPKEIQHLTTGEVDRLSLDQTRRLSQGQLSYLIRCPPSIPAFNLVKDSWFLVAVNDLENPRYAGHEAWQSILGSLPFRSKLEKLKSLVLAWDEASEGAEPKQLAIVPEAYEDESPADSNEAGYNGEEKEHSQRNPSGLLAFLRRSGGQESPTLTKSLKPRKAELKPFPRRGEIERNQSDNYQLVRRQSSSLDPQGKPGDITRIDKGQGLVVMLYGPPGVGKTMTAECLADLIQKPLYRVDLGQIGEEKLESEIDRIFKNAEHWNAVLLLDEAEAIMMERTPDNMEQNTWVSAFLRKVEYYRGILILTTNLIHLIDPAFESRITYAIEYTAMRDSEAIRIAVWRKFVEEIDLPTHSPKPSLQKIEQWARKAVNLNARQIRNVCHAAEVLAKRGHKGRESHNFNIVQSKTLEEWIDNLMTDTDDFIGAIIKAKRATEEQYMRDLI